MTNLHEYYMHRCIQLAGLGAGSVAPNPMVGAVLVYQDRIIGEGYHHTYGEAHAEVNCLNSVVPGDQPYITRSTLYVSLEPCAHHGKTPPCSDLIIRMGVKEVVIGCRDPFPEVDGKGIEKLEAAGVKTVVGVLEKECQTLNKRFFTFHLQHQPYIILKWAQTANGKMGSGTSERLLISNPITNRLVHNWRAHEAAILVGTNTAMQDDPSLDNRLWEGRSPVRLVIDRSLRLPATLKIFDRRHKTIVFNEVKQKKTDNLVYQKVDTGKDIIPQILDACYQLNLNSILVEGGAKLLQSFIEAGSWDEARIITNTSLTIGNGLAAPGISSSFHKRELIGSDSIDYYYKIR